MIRTYQDAMRAMRSGPTHWLMAWVSRYLGGHAR